MAAPLSATRRERPAAFWVAVILAIGITVALNGMVLAAVWVAIAPHDPNIIPRLGENSTQVLTGWGGGILGVLGAYIGFVGQSKTSRPPSQ